MRMRKLNRKGCEEFFRYVERIRAGGTDDYPSWMLTHDQTSEALSLDIDVEQCVFSSRYEMGAYVAELLHGKPHQKIIGDAGFWSWLALFWFEQFCPKKQDGTRKASMPYHYVLSHDYKHRYRHAVYITWQLVNRYGEQSRFLLCGDMPKRGELIEQLMGRQGILSLEGVVQMASALYTDTKTGRFKRGAASRKSGGCVSRYITWLHQLELTYDLFEITKGELEELIPVEFSRFIIAEK